MSDVKVFFELVLFRTKCGIVSEISRYKFSYVWLVVEPLLYMAVFYLVFGVFLNRGGEGFAAYLLVGLVPWMWFTKTISSTQNSIIGAKGLIMQVKITKALFPTVKVLQETCKQMVVFMILVVGLLLSGAEVSQGWFFVPILMIIQFILISGCSFIAAALTPFFPELKLLVKSGLQMLFFASGIFHRIEISSPKLLEIFYLNPVAVIVSEYRNAILYGGIESWGKLLYVLGFGLILCFFAAVVIYKNDNNYPRIVST